MVSLALVHDVELLQAYVGVTLAIPVFLTALVALGCALLFIFAGTLGASLDDRGNITMTVVLLTVVLWGVLAALRRLLVLILPPGPLVSLREIVRRAMPPDEVGSKAALIAKFSASGAPTMPGWVLRAKVFDRAARKAGFVPDATEPPTAALARLTVPRRELKLAYAALRAMTGQRFMIRSSFGDEDTAVAAAPGIYASEVWSRDEGAAGLNEAILRVWRSYYAAHAVQYRRTLPPGRPARLAILLQPECAHQRTGVVASADVIFERRDRHLVDVLDDTAAWSGTHDLLIDNVMACPGSDPLFALDETAVRRLSQLAGAAERLVGRSAEVEWGLNDGRVTVYQARGITGAALARTVTNAHLAELPGYPMTPLSKSFLFDGMSPLELLRRPMRALGLGELPDETMVEIHGRPYLDVTPFKALILGSPEGGSLGLKGVFHLLRRPRQSPSALPEEPTLGPDEFESPPRLVAKLRTLQRAELQPRVYEQGKVLLLAGAIEGLLTRLTEGKVPPPRLVRPVQGEAWFHADELAELSCPRVGESKRIIEATGEVSASGATSTEPRDVLVGYLARTRDALLSRRERLNAEIAVVNHEARQLALALDARLGEQEDIWRIDDVFYATLPELEAVVRSDAASAIPVDERQRRRAALAKDRREAPLPIVIVEDDGTFHPPQAPLGREGATLVGLGIGVGVAEGRLRKLDALSPVSSEEVRGCIVLLPDSSPRWTAHVLTASGVVLMRGGPLSHLALLCRERGTPALASARGQIDDLEDGALVRVDATSGSLQLVEYGVSPEGVDQTEGADGGAPTKERDA